MVMSVCVSVGRRRFDGRGCGGGEGRVEILKCTRRAPRVRRSIYTTGIITRVFHSSRSTEIERDTFENRYFFRKNVRRRDDVSSCP